MPEPIRHLHARAETPSMPAETRVSIRSMGSFGHASGPMISSLQDWMGSTSMTSSWPGLVGMSSW